ncbi:hypothetical protein ABZU76_07855 [Amycolatopsis sp. NPDC005232]|uniref:hypothetical protein n=1 Tax=Amycolatopsis sp. NPDC005232 TaxID=3157027 RepID=UPI0033A1869C
MSGDGWLRIGTGTGEHVALAVDFESSGRPEAGFGDLAKLLPDVELWLTVSPPGQPGRALSAEDYFTWWADWPMNSAPIASVFGFCAGSVFAPELAARIERVQGRCPAVVLFDPERPGLPNLHRDFDRAVAMASLLTAEEADELRAGAQRVREERWDDFTAASAELVELYEQAGSTAFARSGIDKDLAGELLGMFRSYVSYLVAGYELTSDIAWANAVAVTSTGSRSGARHAARELSFPVPHDDLLRYPGVAGAVREILGARRVAR